MKLSELLETINYNIGVIAILIIIIAIIFFSFYLIIENQKFKLFKIIAKDVEEIKNAINSIKKD